MEHHRSSQLRVPDLEGKRLLLVEDNDVNRELAEELLKETGAQIDTGRNGREAVELASSHPYDLILMDCQMPVMDGFDATREIRINDRLKHLPIIAMTANVMAGDRAACLAAGMNDHIAKPIDVAQLYQTLQDWLSAAHHQDAAVKTVTEATPGLLNEQSALARLGGNLEMYRRLQRRFHEDQQETIAKLQAAEAAGRLEEMIRLLHTLRGLAGNLGADALVAASASLETHLKDNGLSAPVARMPLMQAVESSLAAILQHVAGKAAPATTATTPRGSLPGITADHALANLRRLLAGDDAAAAAMIVEIEPWLRPLAGSELFEQLKRRINRYDYDDALMTLDAIEALMLPAPEPAKDTH